MQAPVFIGVESGFAPYGLVNPLVEDKDQGFEAGSRGVTPVRWLVQFIVDKGYDGGQRPQYQMVMWAEGMRAAIDRVKALLKAHGLEILVCGCVMETLQVEGIK